MSGTCHSTSTRVVSAKHSAMNRIFHHDRIMDARNRVVIHSRVSINSYNVNAQSTI
jgi:hypothetical protein